MFEMLLGDGSWTSALVEHIRAAAFSDHGVLPEQSPVAAVFRTR
jgi:hypothetical protein